MCWTGIIVRNMETVCIQDAAASADSDPSNSNIIKRRSTAMETKIEVGERWIVRETK